MSGNNASELPDEWWFDDVPCGRTRKQGLIQKKTFSRDLDTFVREILQNSIDARDDDSEPVEVTFKLREFGDKTAFEDAILWDDLYNHVKSGGRDQDGHGLTDYVEYLEDGGAFRVLTIEEKNGKGIQGNEEDQDSDYAALIRDPGSSNKGGSTGGRHGLGSTLLWVASGFQTVLFNSTLADERSGQTSPRIVGRSFIPTHELSDGECYDNDGWFGSPSGLNRAELMRPESIWGDTAAELATDLGMSRPDANGTTIMIPGFRDPSDPAMDDQPSPEELCGVFEKASAEYFWPAVSRGDLEVDVEMCGHEATINQDTIRDYETISPFVECYNKMDTAPGSFNGPGTVAKTDYEYTIKSKKESECEDDEDYPTPTDGEITVAARKANPSDTDGNAASRLGEIAMFRGPGMVVKYKPGHYLGHSGKYHGILAAGKARTDPEDDHSDTDEAVDDFLAMAEPPMHDKWYGKNNDELKAEYEQGCAGIAEDISTKLLRNALSKILYSQSERSGSVIRPNRDILPRTRSDITTEGDGPPPSTPSVPLLFEWTITDKITDGEWIFDGTVGPNQDRQMIANNPLERWDLTFELVALFEDGTEADHIIIEDVDIQSVVGGTVADVVFDKQSDGKKGHIEVSENIDEIEFAIKAQLPGTESRLGDVTKTRLKITDGSVEVSR